MLLTMKLIMLTGVGQAHSKKLTLGATNVVSILPNYLPSSSTTPETFVPTKQRKSRCRFVDSLSKLFKKLSISSNCTRCNKFKVCPIDRKSGNTCTTSSKYATVVEVRVLANGNLLSGRNYAESSDQDQILYVTTQMNIFKLYAPLLKLSHLEYPGNRNPANRNTIFSRSLVLHFFDEIAFQLTTYRAEQASSSEEPEFQPPFFLKLLLDNSDSNVKDPTVLSSTTTSIQELQDILRTKSIYENSQYYLYLKPIYCSLPFEIDVSLYVYLDQKSDFENCLSRGDYHHITNGGQMPLVGLKRLEVPNTNSILDDPNTRFIISIESKMNKFNGSFVTFGYLKQQIAKKYGGGSETSEYHQIKNKLISLYTFKSGYRKNSKSTDFKCEDIYKNFDSVQLGNRLLKKFGHPFPEGDKGRIYIRPGCRFFILEKVEE